MSIIIGASRIEQLDQNLAATKLKLDAEDLARLDEVSALPAEYPGWMVERQTAGRRPAPFVPKAWPQRLDEIGSRSGSRMRFRSPRPDILGQEIEEGAHARRQVPALADIDGVERLLVAGIEVLQHAAPARRRRCRR